MKFGSILFEHHEYSVDGQAARAPACFRDLNLDQIIDAVTANREEYDLKPFFYTPLDDAAVIGYRHEVFQDLEDRKLFKNIEKFAEKMVLVRRYLALIEKLYTTRHREGWFLEAAEVYCEAIADLSRDLRGAHLESRGFVAFRAYVTNYARSEGFVSLRADVKELQAALATIQYCVRIKDGTVRVRKYDGEIDYSADVRKTFEKFKQGAVKDYRAKLTERSGMNHVEAQILDCVARLYPDIFARVEQFCARYSGFLDNTIGTFDREVQFYIAYLEHIAAMKREGLPFCYPRVSTMDKEVYDYDGFDLALAHKLIHEEETLICNDFHLEGRERIIVVSGPNQGGKTTFARTFGQLHYLASLGCPVPGRKAKLFLYDKIFTHFEREENIENLRGKLQDDLVRVHGILDEATSDSVIVINEIFTSTTSSDAAFLGREILVRIMALDVLCVCVTFIDELASLSEKTVSMVSTVVPDNPAVRTYKILRQPADGLAYARSIAEKHRLTYRQLKERIEP